MNLQSFYTFRKRFLFIVGLSLLFAILLISLSPESQRENVGNITNPISIIIAASLSVLILYKQKTDGEIGKAFLMLTLGLILWAVAEILFTYSEIRTLELERNIMLSDLLWLLGYGPLIYYSLKMYMLFHNYSSKKSIAVIIIMMIAYLAYILPLILDTYSSSSNEVLTFFPWMFVAMIIIGIADSIFAYTSVSGYYQLEWITTPIYTSGYLLMAFGLYWHYKFFIYK